jgi:segregation and condensation protein A
MLHVENYLKCHKHFSFRELLERQTGKINVIVTFLVMLELMKVGKITIYQEDIFDDIIIESQIFEGEQ